MAAQCLVPSDGSLAGAGGQGVQAGPCEMDRGEEVAGAWLVQDIACMGRQLQRAAESPGQCTEHLEGLDQSIAEYGAAIMASQR